MSDRAASAVWSPQQREWLKAMGYSLYVVASGDDLSAVVEVDDARPHAEPQKSTTPAAPERRTAPRAPDESLAETPRSTPRAPTPRMRTASRLPDRLHFALIRASGCNPNADGAAELFATWPSSAELRGNPAAKRALWPTLRALRRPSNK